MSWQTITALLLVALAAIYVARRMVRTWINAKHGCAGGCGCPAAPKQPAQSEGTTAFVPVEQLTLRPPRAPSP